jgi:serine/threonine protein kinase
VDGRADIYSLGIMAFEMVAGRVPFYSETIRELLQMHVRKKSPNIERIREGLPEGLVKFINGALIKRPEERLTDWDEIKKLLNPGLADQVPDIRSDRTQLLSATFPAALEAAVTRELDAVAVRLARLEGVEVQRGDLAPIGGRNTGSGRQPGWFSRFRGETQSESRGSADGNSAYGVRLTDPD